MKGDKKKCEPKYPFNDAFVQDICFEVYKACLGEDDVQRVMVKSANEGKDGESVLRNRALFYRNSVRKTLETLHNRGVDVLSGEKK